MRNTIKTVAIGAIFALTVSIGAQAEEKSADQYLQEAIGVLHHSCQSLIDKYGTDEDAIVDVVEKMIAVSLYNRDIDFTTLELTDAETEEIWKEFVDEIGDRCASDANLLLAGIIDRTVAELVQFY